MNDKPNPDLLGPSPGEDYLPTYSHALVLAEVIFTCELGVQSRRVQFPTRSVSSTFPLARLQQLQHRAATQAVAETKAGSNGAIKKIEVIDIVLLGVIDCGWMTEAQFEAGVADNETPPQETGTASDEDNVVPLRPA